MYSRYRLARKYLRYYVGAASGKGHGIHSPFVYDLVRNVLIERGSLADYKPVEDLRRQLRRDRTMLEIEDMGAGSRGGGQGSEIYRRSIADLSLHAAKPAKLGRLLYRIARHYRPASIVELGTSLGLSTAYLAAGADAGLRGTGDHLAGGPGLPKIVTIEGADAVAGVAERNFRLLGLRQVELVRGNFDEVLPEVLQRSPPVELAFIDGNHRLEPTVRYFEQISRHASESSVLIFDDIHWSREMEEAWKRIRKDEQATLTVDLFFFGLVFRRPEFKIKQDFTIRF